MQTPSLKYITKLFENASSGAEVAAINSAAASAFGAKMGVKLQQAQDDGRHGWHDKDTVSDAQLRFMLETEMNKPINRIDFVDVANYAMMLHYRTKKG